MIVRTAKSVWMSALLVGMFITSSTSVATENAQQRLMPMPAMVQLSQGELTLPNALSINITGFSEARGEFQLTRLREGLTRVAQQPLDITMTDAESAHIHINVVQQEKSPITPSLGADESYRLSVTQDGIRIRATTVFGAQHGIATLLQLARADVQQGLRVPLGIVKDSPRFAWRGLLIDSARQFFSVETIKRQLDGMAAAKLNVLHWHLTDDQGWRIESKTFPKLAELASDGRFYRQSEIQAVVEYASLLGIRVVPEIGMPGHASSIAVAYPELMAKAQKYDMELGFGVFKPLLDVSNPQVFTFIDKLLTEITTLFPDHYFHIGGDEVEPEHWLSNSRIQALMKDNGLKDGHDIQNHFNTQLLPLLQKHQRIMMGWDEIFHPQLPKSIVVQSWRGHDSLNAVAKAGYQGVLSTGFYIDQPQYTDYHYRNDPIRHLPNVDAEAPITLAKQFSVARLKGSPIRGELVILGEQVLIKLNQNHHVVAEKIGKLNNTPHELHATMDSWMGPLQFEFDFQGQDSALMIGNSRYPLTLSSLDIPSPITLSEPVSNEQAARILGAEATIWSEMVTERNLDLRIWPRLFAIAERLWSPATQTNQEDMYARLAMADEFVHHVVGLKHRIQQQTGFNQLINASSSQKAHSTTLELLNQLALWLEPSHYYTRHHIKYQLGQYSTQMPLDNYVDFLAVESEQIRELDLLVSAYLSGQTDALKQLNSLLVSEARKLEGVETILMEHPHLQALAVTANKLQQFFSVSHQIIASCQGDTNKTDLSAALLQLQALNDEIVIAGIYPMRNLYLGCQKQ